MNLLVAAARCHSLTAVSATPVRRAGGNAAEDRNGVRTPYCEVDRWKDHLVCHNRMSRVRILLSQLNVILSYFSHNIFSRKRLAEMQGVFWCAKVKAMSNNKNRPDQDGTHRGAFEKNKKKIYATQTVCGICGKPVDFKLKYPHPLSPCIDHIIPVSKGGHPSDIDNLQLAHWTCNRQKSDKLFRGEAVKKDTGIISNRILPQSMDWKTYRSK